MYPRYAADRARMILADTPILGLIGPRQSGKTTLAQQLEPDRRYITLDDPNTLAAARPDQVERLAIFTLEQAGEDRGGEAGIVELDRKIVAAFLGGFLPAGAHVSF
jgi:hypothetical protein